MPSSSSNSSEPMSDIVNRCRANSNLCKASYLLLGKHGSLSVCGRLLFVLPKRLCEVNLKVKFRPYTLSTQFASVMSTWISVEPRTAQYLRQSNLGAGMKNCSTGQSAVV